MSKSAAYYQPAPIPMEELTEWIHMIDELALSRRVLSLKRSINLMWLNVLYRSQIAVNIQSRPALAFDNKRLDEVNFGHLPSPLQKSVGISR
jgi:hypothetical protein